MFNDILFPSKTFGLSQQREEKKKRREKERCFVFGEESS
jgi:hypothetical protein